MSIRTKAQLQPIWIFIGFHGGICLVTYDIKKAISLGLFFHPW
jgi:hypothetical protein